MSEHSGVHSCKESPSCKCHIEVSNPSEHQTLDELGFEKGIWTSAQTGDNLGVEHKLALSGGLVVNKADKSGFTALHYACRNGHIQVCQTLLDHHADVNVATKSSRATPLHRAAYMGHANIVSLLLQHGQILWQLIVME
ncbi:ankyrin repeat domain-containing protein 39-like [Physella acuta]|uniref:ankyrin repeat domain-containing protein 39-like n=1 Tax=Physella acuta TaxID=109671 RepID=UPI0027DD7354|nr:ankyrin repeat domain-containing protein 39-like [Physella acuta]